MSWKQGGGDDEVDREGVVLDAVLGSSPLYSKPLLLPLRILAIASPRRDSTSGPHMCRLVETQIRSSTGFRTFDLVFHSRSRMPLSASSARRASMPCERRR